MRPAASRSVRCFARCGTATTSSPTDRKSPAFLVNSVVVITSRCARPWPPTTVNGTVVRVPPTPRPHNAPLRLREFGGAAGFALLLWFVLPACRLLAVGCFFVVRRSGGLRGKIPVEVDRPRAVSLSLYPPARVAMGFVKVCCAAAALGALTLVGFVAGLLAWRFVIWCSLRMARVPNSTVATGYGGFARELRLLTQASFCVLCLLAGAGGVHRQCPRLGAPVRGPRDGVRHV